MHKDDVILILGGLLIVFVVLTFSQYSQSKKWQDRYDEQFNINLDQKEAIERMDANFNETMERLQTKTTEFDELKEWARNVYCEVVEGNADVKFTNGSSYYRSLWTLYIDRKEITLPPLKVVDCREK